MRPNSLALDNVERRPSPRESDSVRIAMRDGPLPPCLPRGETTTIQHNSFTKNQVVHGEERVGQSNPMHRYWLDLIGKVLIAGFVYFFLCIVFDETMISGPVFNLAMIWLMSHFGGLVAQAIRLPPLIGMMAAGVAMNSIPGVSPNLPGAWSAAIRSSGLTVILLRSGLELDVTAVRESGSAALRLTCIPGILEAVASGTAAMLIFKMTPLFAFSLGFMLSAVSPAIVVVGMFKLKKMGYGVAKGIPSLVVAAASFDDVVAIAGFSLFIGLAMKSGTAGIVEALFHGPLTVIFGVVLGSAGALLTACTKLWNQRWKRSTMILCLGLIFSFGMSKLHFSGSGAFAALVMAIMTSILWRRGQPITFAVGADEKYTQDTEADLEFIWSTFSEPLLFGVIGAAVDITVLASSSKSVLVILAGLCVRLPAAFFATCGVKQLTSKERLFVALAWTPKATVQAALCSLPLEMIMDSFNENDENYATLLSWGAAILSTAVLSIILTALPGSLFITKLGPMLLAKDLTDSPSTKRARLDRKDGINTAQKWSSHRDKDNTVES